MPAISTVTPSGIPDVDFVDSGTKWAVSSLTYSFPTSASFYTGANGAAYGSSEELIGFKPFTALQQAATASIFNMYSSVANLTFTQIAETSTQSADIRLAESNAPTTAWGYYPTTSPEGGDAWFNNSSGLYNNPVVGDYAWLTIIHEIGHTVGLKHPQDVFGSFGAVPANIDSLEYSVMSYRSYTGASTTQGLTNATWSFPTTLMMYDIAALQYMYGANYSTNSGDTVYKWNPSTGQETINGVAQAAPGGNTIFMTIWDGGGNDTYDFSNYTTNLSVNLQPGAWTTTAAAQLANLGAGHIAIGNIANALLYNNDPASLIENAIGGSGNDTIVGNDADNKLTGGAGNDTLDGAGGTNTAVYSGPSIDYQVSQNADGSWTVTDLRPGSPDGTDTLKNIQLLQFSDTTVAIGTVTPPPVVQAPAIGSVSPDSASVGDGITNANVLTLTGTAEANSTVKVYDGASLLGSALTNATGSWSFATAVLSDGNHSFTATSTDTSGNTSAASSVTSVIVDTVAPVTPTISLQSVDSGIVGDGITNVNVISLTGQAEINSTIKVYDGATLLGSATANAEGVWNFVANLGNDQILAPIATAAITSVSRDLGQGVVLIGTAGANSTVSIYDASGTLLGTTAAGANGAWRFAGSSTAETFTVTAADANPGSTPSSPADAAAANQNQAWGFTTGPMPDGVHNFTITSTDAAGNTSAASAVLAVTIDSTAPVAPTVASFSADSGVVGDRITNANVLTLTGTAEANSTVKVYDGASLLGTASANGSGAWNYTTAVLANGAHSLTATATDAAGNTSAASTALAVTVDTLAPSSPVIASDTTINTNEVVLTGTAEANSTVKVYDGASLLGTASANGSGAWNYTTAVLANGAHSLTATATDAAGNTSAASTALAVTIDTTAPVAPTVASFSTDSGVVGDHITNDSTLTLTGTAEANSTVKVYDGASLLGTASANGSGAWSYTTAVLANGAHSLTATATDAAGNTSAASTALAVTIDTTASVAPTIASFSTDSGVVGDHITNDSTLTLTGTAEANSTVKVYDGASLLGTASANGSGAWSYTTAVLANGAHSLTATATDAAGNTSAASTALAVTIDTTAPVAPTVASFSTDSGVVGDHITNDSTLTLTGTAEANSTVKVYDGASLLGTASANGSGAWNYTTAVLANGAHSLTATATDAVGNTSAASTALAVTVDTLAPSSPVIVSDTTINTNEVVLTGTAEANSTVKVYDGASLLGTASANGSGAWSYTTAVLANGAHGFTATAMDAAGNISLVSQAIDPLIGTVVTIEADGSTSLTAVADQYFLYNGVGAGPALQLGGAAVVAGGIASWTPIGAEQTANGYEVAWKVTGADQYTVWNTNNSGNYVSNALGVVSGASYALQSAETALHQDLNGDGHIGPVATAIEANGSTSLTAVADQYFLYNGVGAGPALQLGGAAVVADEFASWTPIGAEQTANGYEVAWKVTGADQYTVWNTNNSGNYVSNALGVVSGASYALQSAETALHQDLNGDGHIGPVATAIEANGSTSLTAVADQYFLYNGVGAGPALQLGGAAVVADEFASWTPIGAEQTANGYEVAWKVTGADQYTVWNTNNSGNYVSNALGVVSGASYALQSAETALHQDLNGDGHIGPVATAIEANGSTSLTAVADQYFLYNGVGAGPALQLGGAAVVADEFASWTPIGAEQTANGYEVAWKVTGADQYTVWNTNNSGNYVSNALGVVSGSSYALQSAETTLHQDLNGDGHIGLAVNAGATLELAGTQSGPVDFLASTGLLKLDNPASFNGAITGFTGDGTLSGSDQIDLSNVTYNSSVQSDSTYNSATGILDVNNGSNATVLHFAGSYSLANFKFASDGHGGTIVYDPPTTNQSIPTVGSANVVNGTTTTNNAANEILFGNGESNTFVFSGKISNGIVADFPASRDAVPLIHNAFASVADVLAHAAQVGSDGAINIDPSNSATLHNAVHSQLTTNSFHLV